MANTSVVHRISVHPTAETSPPSAPALNANLAAATLIAAGWTTIGSKDRGDDCDIDSDKVTVNFMKEGTKILPPGSLTARKSINRHAGASDLAFVAYDVAEDIISLDSNMDVTSHNAEFTTTQTERAVLIEYDGLKWQYFPKVVLNITKSEGGFGPGDDAVAKASFTGDVLGTDTYPGGVNEYFYQSGT